MEKRDVILQQAKRYDSFYLYDEGKILKNTGRLKRDFPGVEFFYSLKANPAPAVVKTVLAQGFGADAASLAEVALARRLGLSPAQIQYSAPGKSGADLEGALEFSTLVADSVEEMFRIQDVAEKRGVVAEIGIRVNPNFTFSGPGGVPSKFGIDEKQVFEDLPAWKRLPNVKITGIHVHSRSQELDGAVLEGYYERVLGLAARFREALGCPLAFVNMGSGLGIPYSPGETALDTASLGQTLARLVEKVRETMPGTRIILETGRYAVGESGCYATKVMDRKESMGTTFVLLHNTLNGFLRPSLARLVADCSGQAVPAPREPLFTGTDAFRIAALTQETETETVTLVGNLCTAADVAAKEVTLPRLRPGDVVVFSNAGSYGAVLSPMQFSSQAPPAQLFLATDGTVTDAMEYVIFP